MGKGLRTAGCDGAEVRGRLLQYGLRRQLAEPVHARAERGRNPRSGRGAVSAARRRTGRLRKYLDRRLQAVRACARSVCRCRAKAAWRSHRAQLHDRLQRHRYRSAARVSGGVRAGRCRPSADLPAGIGCGLRGRRRGRAGSAQRDRRDLSGRAGRTGAGCGLPRDDLRVPGRRCDSVRTAGAARLYAQCAAAGPALPR